MDDVINALLRLGFTEQPPSFGDRVFYYITGQSAEDTRIAVYVKADGSYVGTDLNRVRTKHARRVSTLERFVAQAKSEAAERRRCG